jgi:DNA-binding PadR family transcriptional regulator
MGTKNIQDSINSKLNLLHILHRTGKIPKDIKLSKPTIYSLLNKWESEGFIEVSKKGRDLSVSFTDRGRDFISSLEKLSYLIYFL